MFGSRFLLLITFSILLINAGAFVSAQEHSQLQLTLVGSSTGEYSAPAGKNTVLMVEIFNNGPSDVYLIRADAYLDPNLTGNWQLVQSDNTDNFHVPYLRSAIWAFNLTMPSNIVAPNATSGIPQIELQLRITYSMALLQHTASTQFLLNAPGATLREVNYSMWITPVVVIALAVAAGAIYYRRTRTKKSR